jgi:hypothetical protein
MKNYFFSIIVVIFFLSVCAVPEKVVPNEAELIFQTGFEPQSRIIPRGNDADITGTDRSLDVNNDWVRDLDENPVVGNFNIQYQGGDSTQRFAKIIPEPGKPENHVLWFWLDDANVGGTKGRIQANIYGAKTGMKEFYQSVRMFLPDDMRAVRSFPEKIHWLTIAEFWNNITWRQEIPHRYRLTLGIGKQVSAESDLYFIVDGQDCQLFADGRQKYTTLWSKVNQQVEVPIGQWFTLEYYYKEGNAKNGRFWMAIQPEGENRKLVFDLTNFTHNSTDPSPDGVTDFNPLKLYTSKKLIDYMSSQDKTLQIFWDDFKLWKDKRPE